jgi:hypothetical protein
MGTQKDTKIVLRANTEFKNEYKKLCETNGYTYSKRIIMLITKDIDYLKNHNE